MYQQTTEYETSPRQRMGRGIQARYLEHLPFAVCAVFISALYTTLRFSLSYQSSDAPLSSLADLSAPRPFVFRLLVPVLASFTVRYSGLPVATGFKVFEFISSLILIYCLRSIFCLYLPKKSAQTAAAILPLAMTAPFVFLTDLPIYYPSDTTSLALLSAGILCLLKQKWTVLLAVTALASLNRETSLILPLATAMAAITKSSLKPKISLVALLFALHLLIRAALAACFIENPGQAVSFLDGTSLRITANMSHLAKPAHLLQFFASLLFLPLLWVLCRKNTPAALLILEMPAAVFAFTLFIVGNVNESRCFADVILLLYLGVIAALKAKAALPPA